MTLDPHLEAALRELAATMAGAADPWWLIGSAATALHGAPVTVADIDLLTSPNDARRLFGPSLEEPPPSALFRSDLFARRPLGGFTLEVMAGFHVREGKDWSDYVPQGRCEVRLGDALLYTPGIGGLVAMCALFGRPKDLERKRLLERI